ncbi:PqqD family protein [Cellulosimicrobium arenosum]|uniref:PqqD family protein n=1 Tax=Cellulosimicrobium arenosum TaxID=2708133 RepID=A0A927G8M0_9MICO|nr:PqqD family protein [Cellulosimicrobium arenosum]MBD8078929.1 PqqD family protein [Cellulosimicrobium arenosum]
MQIRTDGVTWQEIDGELVLLDLERSVYLTTNASGALLTKLLVEDRSLDDLADALVAQFEIQRDDALRDAQAFVDELVEHQLLR